MKYEFIGLLAVQLHTAYKARLEAKETLRKKYAEFCKEYGHYNDGSLYLGKDHRAYGDMQAYAVDEVAALKRAQLDEYNLKRKLRRAIEALER